MISAETKKCCALTLDYNHTIAIHVAKSRNRVFKSNYLPSPSQDAPCPQSSVRDQPPIKSGGLPAIFVAGTTG